MVIESNLDKSIVESGDLLIWGYASTKDSNNKIENFFSNVVQYLTHSEYGHLGIAWKTDTGLYVVEARIPEIKITPILRNYCFHRIEMGIEWDQDCLDWLLDKVGCKYSIVDAIRAFFGKKTLDNNRWQCAELVKDFYARIGIDLGEVCTPKEIVNAAQRHRNPSIQLITDNHKCNTCNF